jgi:hypothetical protein
MSVSTRSGFIERAMSLAALVASVAATKFAAPAATPSIRVLLGSALLSAAFVLLISVVISALV